MRSFIYALATGLAGAAVLHILIILAVPHFTGRDAFTRIEGYEEAGRFFPLTDRPNSLGLSNGDPFLRLAVCAFSVEDRPVHLLAAGALPFWSYSVFDSSSNEIYSMNDRTALRGNLDTIIASPAQLTVLRKDNPDIVAQSVLVEMPAIEGYVVLRALATDAGTLARAEAFLGSASCESL